MADAASNTDWWSHVRGSDGALFGAVIIVIALWTGKLADSKKMDKRHEEMLQMQKDLYASLLKTNEASNEKLMELAAENIKARLLNAEAVRNMDGSIKRLINTLGEKNNQSI